jgi:hypothetical protein
VVFCGLSSGENGNEIKALDIQICKMHESTFIESQRIDAYKPNHIIHIFFHDSNINYNREASMNSRPPIFQKCIMYKQKSAYRDMRIYVSLSFDLIYSFRTLIFGNAQRSVW